MQVFFCDCCSRRVTEGELAEGDGVRIGTAVFCKFCCRRPEVREYLDRVPAAAGSLSFSDGRGQQPEAAERHRVGRRTPHRGHTRVRPKSPHGRRPTPRRLDNVVDPTRPRRLDNVVDPTRPRRLDNVVDPTRPVRPVSPVRPRPAVQGGKRPTPLRLPKVPPRKSGLQLLLYGLVGTAAGLTVVAAASMVTGRRVESRELLVRWGDPELASTGARRTVVFDGKCTIGRPAFGDSGRGAGRLFLRFPSGGSWKVSVNGRMAHYGKASGGGRALVGRAAAWLVPGANTIRAARLAGGDSPVDSTGPPELLIE